MIRHLLCTFAMATLLLTGAAHAQTPTVKDLFENGQLHFDGGQYELAIEAWQAAYDQSARPILLVKMADAWEALGDLTAAIDVLETYRDLADEAEVAPVNARIARLEAQLVKPVPQVDPPDPSPADPTPPPDPVVRSRSKTPVVVEGILIGVAASGLGVGAGYGFRAKAARTQAMTFCVDGKGGLMCTDGADDALARDKSSSLAADAGFLVGGVAAVAATVNGLVLTRRASAIRVTPAPWGVGIQFTR